jgi:hypothetical protein
LNFPVYWAIFKFNAFLPYLRSSGCDAFDYLSIVITKSAGSFLI